MVSATVSGATTNLSYDPLGRLYQVAGTSTAKFLYSGDRVVAEYNGSDALQRRFVPGAGVDETVVWYEGSVLTNRNFLMADERGSVVAVTNSSGAVTTINKYDDYGAPASGNAGRFQYTGQMWLSEIGLYHYKARIYHPSIGRFMQTDPIGYSGGMTLYAYVGNDPINGVDPSGMESIPLFILTDQYFDSPEAEDVIVVEGIRSCDAICDWRNNQNTAAIIAWLNSQGGLQVNLFGYAKEGGRDGRGAGPAWSAKQKRARLSPRPCSRCRRKIRFAPQSSENSSVPNSGSA